MHGPRLAGVRLGHDVRADVEVLPSAQVNTALTRLGAGDVRHRFVLDLADLALDPDPALDPGPFS